ncbi:MAG: hypothetical protein LBU77_02235 [Clostridiales bacterium]|jgi:hypothetical protein|nr:hypothetical protein [Clostridiales bacterium]
MDYKNKKSGRMLFLMITVIAMLVSSLSLYAGDDKKADEKRYKKAELLSMTTGESGAEDIPVLALVGLDDTNEIKTFDEKKSFSGTAEKGTQISATVYVPAGKDEWKAAQSYSDKVGSSGLFNISIDFNLGENIVVIEAVKGQGFSKRAFTVNRKDSEIRDRLTEQPKALPRY